MITIDSLRLALRMFRTNRSRTILTILGISVGIGAILFLVSLGYGLEKMIYNQLVNSDTLLTLDVEAGELDGLKFDDEAAAKIRAVPGVKKISPLLSSSAQIVIDDISTELSANFADQDYLKLDGLQLKAGELYKNDNEPKIIISSMALKLFNIEEKTAVGKKAKIVLQLDLGEVDAIGNGGRRSVPIDDEFVIVGIVNNDDSSFVNIPFGYSKAVEKKNYSKIKVGVNQEQDLNPVRGIIVDAGYRVSSLSDVVDQANQVFSILKIILASFGIVALVVSAIGMFNTMTIALLERTQEIGIMKSLGATGFDIWRLFLTESFIIGFLGGVGGILIGFLGGELFNYIINIMAGALGGAKIDIFYSPTWFVLTIMTFSSLVGLITGFYPARRAANINCLEALRYK